MSAIDSMSVQYDLRPAYYDDFHCLAGDCRQNCCMDGWHITFDRKDYMRLKQVKGSPELNARMTNALRRIRSGPLSETYFGEFRLNEENGDCPLHCENGLCLLQLEKGYETLPQVCRIFPRAEKACASGYFERSLDPGCEEVLALLWDLPEGVDFRTDPLPKATAVHFPMEYRGTLMEHFQEIRSLCIDILQDRRMPLSERMMLLGLALKKLVDGETNLERWKTYVQLLSEQTAAEGLPMMADQGQSLAQFLINTIAILRVFPVSIDQAPIRRELLAALDFEMKQGGSTQGTISLQPYLDARARYEERFAGREYFIENLMVSIFFQLKLPGLNSMERLWRDYVTFCNLYGIFRFLSVMSCREGAPGDRAELFRLIVFGSRGLIHNNSFNEVLLDSLFQHSSTTLAHMAILLRN